MDEYKVSLKDIKAKLGELWSKLSEEDKAPYIRRHEESMALYKRQ